MFPATKYASESHQELTNQFCHIITKYSLIVTNTVLKEKVIL